MNDDELKNLWRAQPLREPALSPAQAIAAMQNKTSEFRRTIVSRDLRELIACAVVIVVFTIYYIHERTPMVRLGWAIIIAGTLFTAFKLIYARLSNPPAPADANLVDSLRAELHSVRAQSRLLGSILWWYLLPPGIGLLVATWGMPVNLHAKIPATIFYIALYGFIYRLNRRARSTQLLPMEAQLESLLHSAETGQPFEPSNVADLRPIVLSMAAADRVRPVEFKVAFWQVALFGEIGFVGFWFFSVISVTIDHFAGAPKPSTAEAVAQFLTWPHLAWLPVAFVGGLIFSRLVQKTTERAVGISALGIHLNRGQILILWDEINEVRPLRVLHIRSLWLIKATGEKFIMPFTSLARRPDLIAVIETCAPPNHPLREQLRLLQ